MAVFIIGLAIGVCIGIFISEIKPPNDLFD